MLINVRKEAKGVACRKGEKLKKLVGRHYTMLLAVTVTYNE